MAFGRNPFLDFLEQAGFTAPAPAVPKYQSRPDLRIRGNAENTAQQTRQYAAPYVAPPVQQQPTPMVARGGSFTPDQVMDQFLMSPAAQFLDPAQLDSAAARLRQEYTAPAPDPVIPGTSPSVPHGSPDVVWQGVVSAWQQENARRQQAGLAPLDPMGNEYDPVKWQTYSPAQRQQVYQQLQESTPAQYANGLNDDFLSRAVRGVGDALYNPVTEPVIDNVVKPVVKALGVPEQKYRMETMDVAYYMATHNGELPNDWSDPGTFIAHWIGGTGPEPTDQQLIEPPPGSSVPFNEWVGMSRDERLAVWKQAALSGENPLSELQIIPYLQGHPEFMPTVRSIYETAEANGQDGTQAVNDWWANQQGVKISTLSSLIFDPLNLVGLGGAAGRAIKTAAKTREAETGVTAGTRITKGFGTALEIPDAALNRPVEAAKAVGRPISSVIGNLPGIKQLTDPTVVQKVEDATRAAEELSEEGVGVLLKAADDVKAQKAAEEAAGRAETRTYEPNAYVPERNLMPSDRQAELDAQMRARRAAANTPEAAPMADTLIPPEAPVNTVRPEVVPTNGSGGAQTGYALPTEQNPNPSILTGSGREAKAQLDAQTPYRNPNLTPYINNLPENASPERIAAAVDAQSRLNNLTSTVNKGSLDGLPSPASMTDVQLQQELYNVTHIPGISEMHAKLRAQRTADVEAEIAARKAAKAIPNNPAITPEIGPQIDTSGFADVPARGVPDPNVSGFSLNADTSRIGKADKERYIDNIAAVLGEDKYKQAFVDSDLGDWARTVYEPNHNMLTTASVDSSAIKGAERMPEGYPEYLAKKEAHNQEIALARKEKRPARRDYFYKDPEMEAYEGVNKAVAAMYDGQFYGRVRLTAFANGVPPDRFQYKVPNRLRIPEIDEELVGRGYGRGQTYKDVTLEAHVYAYIHTKSAQRAADELQYLQTTRLFSGTHFDAKTGAPIPVVPDAHPDVLLSADRAQLLYDARRLANMSEDEMAALIKQAGGEIPEPVIPADDIEKIAKANGPSAQSVAEQIDALDPAIKPAVIRDAAAWAESHAERLAVGTSIEKTYLDLEYVAEVRRSALKNGGDIAIPPATATVDDDVEDMIRAVVLEPAEWVTAPLRQELVDLEVISANGVPNGLEKTNPIQFAGRDYARQNYDNIQRLRTALHGSKEQAVLIGPSPRGPHQAKLLPRPGAGKVNIPGAEVSKKTFRDVTGEPKRPASLTEVHGDQYVEDAWEAGGIDEETMRGLTRYVDIPELTKDGKVVRAASRKKVIDIILEQMVKHDDVLTAHRAAGTEIAEALRQVKKNSTTLITAGDILTMPEVNKLLRANRYYLNLVREAYLLSPARIVSAGTLDAIGNATFQVMSGHAGTALRTLNPMAQLGFAKHIMRGSDIRHPVMEILEKTGMKADTSWMNVVTRDILDPGADTTWSDFLSKKLHMGKVGDKASSVVAPKWGKAWRHGIDQNARAGVAWDTAMKALPDSRNEFLLAIRREKGDEVANLLAPKLDRSGQFSPDDVLKVTGDKQLARAWREELTNVRSKMTAEVNRVHFSFKMTKADDIARHFMLFHFWQSRAMLFYAKTVLSNPYLLNLHVKMYNALEAEAERQDVGNPMNLFLKYMGGNGGLYGYVDPLSWIVPYTMYRDSAVSFNGEKGFDRWTRKFGIFLNPAIGSAATILGFSEQFPAVVPTTAIENLVKSVVDFDKNHGNVLGLGPGMVTDPIAYFTRRVVDAMNNGLHKAFPELISDVEVPDPNRSDKAQVKALVVETAEQDFGTPYANMTPAQREEVGRALAAVDAGSSDNQRANEALKTWSEGQLVEAGARMVIPGQTRVASEYRDQNKKDVTEAFQTPTDQRTSDQQNALATNEVMSGGSPESTMLTVGQDNLQSLGTEQQRALYKGWNVIVYDDLDPNAYEDIGGRRYYGREINAMSYDERTKLADAWALSYMDAPVDTNPNDGIEPKNELDQYRDERDAYIASNPDVQGYDEYKDRANNYGTEQTGGRYQIDKDGNSTIVYEGTPQVRQFREYVAGQSPEFAQSLDQERQRLQAKGVSGEELERQLDQWTTSTDGYNAFRGVTNRMGDAEPISTGEIPLSNSETEQMITDAVAEGVKQGSGGGSSSGFNTEYNRPQFQVDLLNDYQAFVKVKDSFEQQYGPIDNFQSRQGQAAVARFFADQGVEVSKDLKKYLSWAIDQRAAGADDSIEAYFAMQDAEYEAKKAQEAAT